ncbi:hypothetical protein GCM10029976_043200 [Kribbella albertanoniae]|uniref:Cytosolic endo-beta-N-acetylglucosaminidase TIM barrel domain-containing protein n=1 Tax=Kribbella albertanoniae TaxID=1266829 RepID=A0A4R4PPY6_9ACTN|nr:hypothetical protein [Kribbella albertanoniae]TDC24163.1 hypothetical protein E1261_26800 [Kribbella albertanoniae]
MTDLSRRTFITVAGAGLAAALGHAGPAQAAAAPKPGSGGIPPGPSTYGWNAPDLLDFDPATHPWARHLRCLIPRAQRIAPFAPTQAHPDLDPAVQLSMLSHDDAGSIYEGRNQPIGLEEHVYTHRFWPYIDIWGTWHGQVLPSVPDEVVKDPSAPGRYYGVVDLPNPGWTEAAHKNGARAIGGWFWPRTQANFDAFLEQRPDGSFPVADKLIELRRYFGFDGLFINQEATITAAQADKLRKLFLYVKKTDPDFYLQYYDAVLPDGTLDYQNELNAQNVGWLSGGVDSIFLNYDWPRVDPALTGSATTATAAGFEPHKVVFAGAEHQMGGFNPREMFTDLTPPPTSWALFVENQIWATAAGQGLTATPAGRATYRDLEQRFWSGPTGNPTTSGRLEERTPPYRTDVLNYKRWDGVAHAIVERSPYGALPIATSFQIGVGSRFFLAGKQIRDTGWDNQGCADRALTWQYWTNGLTVSLDESAAYEGAHSLAVAGSGAIHLFKTDLTQHGATAVQVMASGLSRLRIGVTWRSAPDKISWSRLLPVGQREGWTEHLGSLGPRADRIARISLWSEGSGHLGKIVLADARDLRERPRKVRDFAVRDEGARNLSFSWSLQEDAVAYDVLQQTGSGPYWLGRVSRDVFFAEAVDLSRGRTFAVVPIAATSNRGPDATVSLI